MEQQAQCWVVRSSNAEPNNVLQMASGYAKTHKILEYVLLTTTPQSSSKQAEHLNSLETEWCYPPVYVAVTLTTVLTGTLTP
jgi:hypothetical protein